MTDTNEELVFLYGFPMLLVKNDTMTTRTLNNGVSGFSLVEFG